MNKHNDMTAADQIASLRPSATFTYMAWGAMGLGVVAYLIGIWNAGMELNEKGYYLICLLFGLYSAVSLQKSVRDREEGLEASMMHYGLSWAAFGSALILLSVGLWNAEMWLSEKGFFGMAFTLALFGAVTIQKNSRDMLAAGPVDGKKPDQKPVRSEKLGEDLKIKAA